MKKPVIAIGLDAADPVLIESWLQAGRLPGLEALCAKGAYGRLDNLGYYKAETPWTTFCTGRLPTDTGYWAPLKLREGTYEIEEIGAYDYAEYPPFYALGPDYRVAVFDVPQSVLSESVNGPQVLAWGAHSPQTDSVSRPQGLLAEINRRYGEHPALHRDHGDWWDDDYLHRLHRALRTGIDRRVAICRDWLREEPWDLFLTVFSETHSAGHDFWHISRPDHPLHERIRNNHERDLMLDVFQAVDRGISEIAAEAPEDSYLVVFSVHGSDNNVTDVASMAILPEFLYRYSFPGKTMLAPGRPGSAVPPPLAPVRIQHWQHELQSYRYDPNQLRRMVKRFTPRRAHQRINRSFGGPLAPDLYSIRELKRLGASAAWQPVQWYSKVWPKMKAFALPTFSEGYIRINVKGREPQGLVEPECYGAICDELAKELRRLVNPRSGKPAVAEVIRTRGSANTQDPKLPDADLIVTWTETPADVVDHPDLGRIGPLPFRRTGSHRSRGFWIATGPSIEPGTQRPRMRAVELPAAILRLMGVTGRDTTPTLQESVT